MIARRADWKRAEQSAARFQVAIAAAQCWRGERRSARPPSHGPPSLRHRMGDASRGPGAPFGAGLFPRPVAYFEI
jgi:hypothetical protein